ncbi:MAG TPA: HIT domain-containing protein [Actinomycetota bacterium]
MAYIKGDERHEGCLFCELPALGASQDEPSLIVLRGALAFVMLNKFPYNVGHVMVAAYRHCGRYDELTPDEHAEMAALTARCVRALEEAYRPHGFNIGVNQGSAAGAGIVDHLHTHVVPRWSGDTNFMSTVGDTKVMPETLDQTYAKLAGVLKTSERG